MQQQYVSKIEDILGYIDFVLNLGNFPITKRIYSYMLVQSLQHKILSGGKDSYKFWLPFFALNANYLKLGKLGSEDFPQSSQPNVRLRRLLSVLTTLY